MSRIVDPGSRIGSSLYPNLFSYGHTFLGWCRVRCGRRKCGSGWGRRTVRASAIVTGDDMLVFLLTHSLTSNPDIIVKLSKWGSSRHFWKTQTLKSSITPGFLRPRSPLSSFWILVSFRRNGIFKEWLALKEDNSTNGLFLYFLLFCHCDQRLLHIFKCHMEALTCY